MTEEAFYEEELFGVLSEDDLYLDCTLVKPSGLADEEMRALRVWVPRYPLTKTSIIACARQEVIANGPKGRVAHLGFDLRGTGYSEGDPRDRDFGKDLRGIRLWAEERFGDIQLSFMGLPEGGGVAQMLPLRPGVVMESYVFEPEGDTKRPPVLYLSTYGNFQRSDDGLCAALAAAGYPVYGVDPLRYLLHASLIGRLQPGDLLYDMRALLSELPEPPFVIGQPLGAGLALIWAAGADKLRGVLAIGRAQIAFRPPHIFANDNPHTFFLGRYVDKIGQRPVALIRNDAAGRLGGDAEELAALYQLLHGPRRLERVDALSETDILEWLGWLESESARQ